MLTHNATISIAAKWLDDANNATLTPEQRDAGQEELRRELIATAGFPNKPDGKPMVYRAAVKVGVIFADCQEQGEGARNSCSSCCRKKTSRPTSRARSAAGSR